MSKGGVAVAAALLGAAVLTLWPAWIAPGRVIPGDPGSDAYDHLWGYWWWAYALAHGQDPLHTTLSHQPPGGALWFPDPLNALLAAPLQAVMSTALATTTVLTAQVYATLLAVWLGLRREAPLGAPVAALTVGAGAYTLGLLQSGVYEYVALGPLAGFYLLLRRGSRPGLAAACWFVAALGNFYYAAFAGLLALTWLVERPGEWRAFVRVALYALPPVVLLAAFAHTTLSAADAVIRPETAPGWIQGSLPAVDPLAFVHPGAYFFPDNARAGNVGIVHVPYVGWITLVLAGVGFAPALGAPSRGGRARAAFALLLALVFALGPALAFQQRPVRIAGHALWMPLAGLYFPGSPFTFVHHTYRLVVVLLLAMAPRVALGVEQLAARLPRPARVPVALLLALLFLAEAHLVSPIGALPARAQRTAPVDPDPFTLAAASDPAVTGIFTFPPDAYRGNRRYAMLATIHQKRMPYGVNSYLPDAWADNGLVLALLGCLAHPQATAIPREGGPPPRGWFTREGLRAPKPTEAQVQAGVAELVQQGYSHVVVAPTLGGQDHARTTALLDRVAERVEAGVYWLGAGTAR